MEEVKQIKEKQEHIYNHNQRFHSQIWQEQEKLAKEIQEVQRGQLAQVAANNQRLEAERNMQMALERQGRDIVEIRKQVNLWTNNVSSKEAYACWAQQQANPNLREMEKGSLRSKKEGIWSILPEPPRLGMPRSPEQQPRVKPSTPRRGHQYLGVPSPPQGQVIHA
ncbi:hypothetical protein PIB30_080420 [Stylosanthes scabra]|uniref:Uncharacterized protein n=1 Tax=Stylosanthes scabra TaxID=79078 RepID=A0ABU6WR52_9FABA|nr:hypothetical protein [Stylosanthes scabra]